MDGSMSQRVQIGGSSVPSLAPFPVFHAQTLLPRPIRGLPKWKLTPVASTAELHGALLPTVDLGHHGAQFEGRQSQRLYLLQWQLQDAHLHGHLRMDLGRASSTTHGDNPIAIRPSAMLATDAPRHPADGRILGKSAQLSRCLLAQADTRRRTYIHTHVQCASVHIIRPGFRRPSYSHPSPSTDAHMADALRTHSSNVCFFGRGAYASGRAGRRVVAAHTCARGGMARPVRPKGILHAQHRHVNQCFGLDALFHSTESSVQTYTTRVLT